MLAARLPETAWEPPSVPAPARTDGIRCRPMGIEDVGAVVNLLCDGFPRRDRSYWMSALRRLETHRGPDGMPRYGYVLQADGAVVGVLLLISATVPTQGRDIVRTNFSSWYVLPQFRMFASMLVSRATKLSADTFVNVSPAVSTWPTIQAQGFRRFSAGAFVAAPMLSRPWASAKIRAIDAADPTDLDLSPGEARLLHDHRAHGCVSLCVASRGADHPFVFRRRLFRRFPLPCAHLIYCRDIGDLRRLAGPIGRYLAVRGMSWIIVSTDDPIPGMIGMHVENRLPMYSAGEFRPRPGDLAYTEGALFGF